MMLSKKPNNIVCIFAHPDDEAFGPAGTIAKLAETNNIYILCATRGEAGGNYPKLAKIRSGELRQSAQILGVKNVYFLGFVDGTLSNSLYHQLAQKIEQKLNILKPQTIMTFEPRGISGHIDHITVSMVTTYVFKKLPFAKTLLYHCISDQEKQLVDKYFKDYFIYFPPGYQKSKIDKIVDVAAVWNIKIKAMMAHRSQIADAQKILKLRQRLPQEEYFLVIKKN